MPAIEALLLFQLPQLLLLVAQLLTGRIGLGQGHCQCEAGEQQVNDVSCFDG
ncbi:hypothetical protein PRtIB026_A47500 [Pseudomonas sp. RtIB026]|nr:hypothetical protein PRtIB026_A47500 [Pseudomonas sp. RtIB026]